MKLTKRNKLILAGLLLFGSELMANSMIKISNSGNYTVEMNYISKVQVREINSAIVTIRCLGMKGTLCKVDGLSLTAHMPAHMHGLNYSPNVKRISPTQFRIEGIFYHMPGYWQVYLDIQNLQRTERAQYDLEL